MAPSWLERVRTSLDSLKRRLVGPPTASVESYKLAKKQLIDDACARLGVRSFADLGGSWGVDGEYTFYALEKPGITKGFLVDHGLSAALLECQERFPQLAVIEGNFGDPEIANWIGCVDAIFLFDVLLHQVDPDWDGVLDVYAGQTRSFLIFNQQWVGSGQTVRLLDLGEEEYFRRVPHSRDQEVYRGLFERQWQVDPATQRPYRDTTAVWQWGITDADLEAKMRGVGFRLEYYKNYGSFFGSESFENHAFLYSKPGG